jgi:hypothetical protein
VQTHQINISHGSDNVHEIRRQLFAFSEILDVFVTSRPDSLVVVCAGRPRLGEWLGALRAVGYEVSARRHAFPGPAMPRSMTQILPTRIEQARRPQAASRAGRDQVGNVDQDLTKVIQARPNGAHRPTESPRFAGTSRWS